MLPPTSPPVSGGRVVDQILGRAQDLMDKGMTIAEVASMLNIRPSNDEAHPIVLSPESNLALGSVIERARQIGDELHDQDERLEKLEKWANQSWWKKLIQKP